MIGHYKIVKTFSEMEFLKELWLFLRTRKKLWLLPLIIVLIVLSLLIVLAGSSALGPLIYSLF